ncbi:hypothetical protein [Saccharothrix sp. Mg75]|uniref:hypothetical protein n=1 Tax=Saccharothrix sp. Mg75 TaxID=3445357 RepID=UPI003EEB9713
MVSSIIQVLWLWRSPWKVRLEAQEGAGLVEGDGAGGGVGLGLAEPELAAGGFVQGAVLGGDDEEACVVVEEVQVVALQAGQFAPACAGPACGDDEHGSDGSVEGGDLVGDAQHLGGLGPDFLGDAGGVVAASASSGPDGAVLMWSRSPSLYSRGRFGRPIRRSRASAGSRATSVQASSRSPAGPVPRRQRRRVG